MMNGYKTYLVAAASLAYAGFGLWTGNLDWNGAMQLVQTAVLGGTIRHGIAKAREMGE